MCSLRAIIPSVLSFPIGSGRPRPRQFVCGRRDFSTRRDARPANNTCILASTRKLEARAFDTCIHRPGKLVCWTWKSRPLAAARSLLKSFRWKVRTLRVADGFCVKEWVNMTGVNNGMRKLVYNWRMKEKLWKKLRFFNCVQWWIKNYITHADKKFSTSNSQLNNQDCNLLFS